MTPGLDADALAVLQHARVGLLARGQVFWLPPAHDKFRRGEPKEAPWLVVALEGRCAARVHLVPGTSQAATGPCVVVEAGEAELPRRTEFDFSFSQAIAGTTLIADGEAAGDICSRTDDIDRAICASNRAALKRLTDQ